MAIKIQAKDKVFVYESDGTKISYKVPSSFELLADLGETVEISRAQAIVAENIVGWENLEDAEGNQVPFDKNLVELLPVDIISEIATAIIGHRNSKTERLKEELKN
jgi:hypothetical protein